MEESWFRGVNDGHGLTVSCFRRSLFFPSLVLFSYRYRFELISNARITRRFEILIYNSLEPGRGDVNLHGIDKPSLVASTTGKGGAL